LRIVNQLVLAGVNVAWTQLRNVNFRDADLRGADLRGTTLVNADLTRAVLTNARIGETVFGNTSLADAKGLEQCRHVAPSTIDHRTVLRSRSLPDQFLKGCGFSDLLISNIPVLFAGSTATFYSCFISYSHADAEFAQQLHTALQSSGIRCWLDQKELLPGDDLYERIDDGVRNWDKLLLCCSVAALTSWWVDNEIEAAFAKERQLMKERGRRIHVLVPLDLDGYLFRQEWKSGKATQLRARIAANFLEWRVQGAGAFNAEVEKVIRALRTDGGRLGPPARRL
jgi:hypothetical protein